MATSTSERSTFDLKLALKNELKALNRSYELLNTGKLLVAKNTYEQIYPSEHKMPQLGFLLAIFVTVNIYQKFTKLFAVFASELREPVLLMG